MALITARRPEAVLLALLSLCLAVLSVQVRRPNGMTAGERWLLDLGSPFVAFAGRVREAVSTVGEWGSTRTRLLRENRELRKKALELETEALRLRDADRDKTRLLELFGV